MIRFSFQPGAKVAARSPGDRHVPDPAEDDAAGNHALISSAKATSVPVLQISVSSDTLTEQQLFDYAANFIIQQLGTVQRARVPSRGRKTASGDDRLDLMIVWSWPVAERHQYGHHE